MEKLSEVKIPSEKVTVEDCIDLYLRRGYAAICNNGKLEGFVLEERKDKHSDKVRLYGLIAFKLNVLFHKNKSPCGSV